MGDFGIDTTVERIGDGTYAANVHPDWEIWGPMGGFVGALALRAIGCEASLPRPVSFFCHYLRGATFGDAEIEVTALRRGRSAESLRAVVRQDGKDVMDATVCIGAPGDGLEHELTDAPNVPGPDGLPSMAELMAEVEDPPPPSTFFGNFESRPTAFRRDWPPPGPSDPVWRQWQRFIPTSTFTDPWVDAARYVLLCDLPLWPAVTQHHAWKWVDQPPPFISPTLDLYVAFHRAVPDEPWLLVEGRAPIAMEGLLGWTSHLYDSSLRVVASGGGQAMFRRVAPRPA